MLSEQFVKAELREYNFKFIYYFTGININKTILVHMLRVISRIESLIASNRSITLTDSTNVINSTIDNYQIVEGSEGFDYLVDMSFSCQHLGNLS